MIVGNFKYDIDPKIQIDRLGKEFNKAMRIACNKAAAPVKAAVIEGAPQHFGFLKKSIRIKVKNYGGGKFKYSPIWAVIIGAKSDFVRKKGKRTKGKNKGKPIVYKPSFYLPLVEKHQRFMERAMATARKSFPQIVCDALRSAVDALR